MINVLEESKPDEDPSSKVESALHFVLRFRSGTQIFVKTHWKDHHSRTLEAE